MKNMMLLLVAAFLCACNSKDKSASDIRRITIKANSEPEKKLNGLLSLQTTVSLDTSVLVAGVGDLCVLDSSLYVLDDQNMSVSRFAFPAGKAISTIKSFGGGPQEYIQPVMLSTDGRSLFLLDFAGCAIVEYDKELGFVRKIKLESAVNDFICIPDGFLCFNSWMGGEANPVVVYNKEGVIQKRINFKRPIVSYGSKGKVFFKDGEQVYFRPFFCDTVYQYKPDGREFSPFALLDFQEKAIPNNFDFQNDVFESPYAFATHVFVKDGNWIISYLCDGRRCYALCKTGCDNGDSYYFESKKGEAFFPQWQIEDEFATVVAGSLDASGELNEEDGCRLLLHTLKTQP